MGNLFTSLLNTSNALGVYSKALGVVSNNVTNANTPGYVKQTAVFDALPFDLTVGLPGGVSLGAVQSSRNAFAEQNVRNEQSVFGTFQQKTSDLSQVSHLFDLTGRSGPASAINGLFQSFSQLSVNPNDPTARQNVIEKATQTAQAFQSTSAGLLQASGQVAGEVRTSVAEINRLAGAIAHINADHPQDYKGTVDAGIDAQLNSNLEELSKFVNYTALQQPDGSVTVYIGGQTPLVIGDKALPIQADFSSPQVAVLDNQGRDIGAQLTQGKLAGQLEVQNTTIPSYIADLNTLAKGVADQVNAGLANGIDANGATPATDLFAYNTNPGAAQTLSVSITSPDQIAAAVPGSLGGNANALSLSALGTARTFNGFTLSGYFGSLASKVGQDISDAQNGQDAHQQLVTQAQNLRSTVSSVSLDEEAEHLIQFQRGYQATAKLIGVLNELTTTTINLVQ